MTTMTCPRCGASMVAGLDGPGTVSCPNLCVVEVDVAAASRPASHEAYDETLLAEAAHRMGIAPEDLEAAEPLGDGRRPEVHEVDVQERLRLQASGGPPTAEAAAAEGGDPEAAAPEADAPVVPAEEPGVRATPPRPKR
jgi:hypothetical protein